MTIVNNPKFTAEASLYRSRSHYRHGQSGVSRADIVVPAIPFAGTVIGFSTIANRMAGVPERYVTPVRWATVSAALKFHQIASHSILGSSLLGRVRWSHNQRPGA